MISGGGIKQLSCVIYIQSSAFLMLSQNTSSLTKIIIYIEEKQKLLNFV